MQSTCSPACLILRPPVFWKVKSSPFVFRRKHVPLFDRLQVIIFPCALWRFYAVQKFSEAFFFFLKMSNPQNIFHECILTAAAVYRVASQCENIAGGEIWSLLFCFRQRSLQSGGGRESLCEFSSLGGH